ncbi:related to proteophosphoglycan ppg4-Leishmania braziliensis [Serendipita indica DSM 11827]|uniref:Related to proteophosphoglycan ppg4-Leishmania braziliensis n=1 Tax=Serendipita indica (strain DSM 11827) TaxID=1109443 RepID=G4TGL0_SERID|nr:related to proteophosphoglycan ppg4-Leishmania braziliensis [Serendipita indica DSM 11827]
MCPTFPPLLPLPLVSLRLGSLSVLDTLVLDADDNHNTLRPLFSIESANDDTSVYRLDHDAHPDPTARLVAAIKWSSTSNKTLVSISGSTHFSSAFLKKTVLGGSRKFHVPGQSNALKWKHVGSHYECTLCSHACTAHRAVATLEPGHTTALPRLSIYTSSVSSNQSDTYKGVDVSLLEYLIVTTILLLRKDHSGHNTPLNTTRNSSHFLAPTTPTTISSSSSGSYSPLFSTSPAAACQRSTSTRSTRSGGHRTPGTRPVLDLLEDEDVPSPTTPYSPSKPPHSPMLKPVTNSPRMRASPLLKPLSACPSPFSSASSSSSVAGGSVSSLPASPVTPFSHMGVHSPLNQDTFATANYQVLNGSHRDQRAENEEATVPFQIPLPASHEHRTLSHSTSYGQLRSPTSASSSSTATFTQSPMTYIPFTSPSTHYAPSPTSPSTHVSTQNVASQRTYAPTPTRPPASSTNNTSAGHAMGRSHSHGAIPRKIANKLPSPILSSLAFFHHHSHSQSTKSASTSGHGKSNSRTRTNDEEREREPEPGPSAITPYQLPPTPLHPPPPPPSAPASVTTYAHQTPAHSMSSGSGSGSTLSRDATITPYTLPPRSPLTQTSKLPHQGENALLLETDMNTSSSGPSPLQYTTEMYHIMFETGQYASNASSTMPQQRRESSSSQPSSQHRRESSTTMTLQPQHTRRESMPAVTQSRRDSASASGAGRPTRIFQEVPAPSASDLEALGIADFFGTGSRPHASPRAQVHPLLQSSPRLAQPHLTLHTTNNVHSSPRLETHTRSPITRTVPIEDFEQLGVDGRDLGIDLGVEETGNGVGEALPSYNEIEWTVRVRQPRVRDRQANANAHNERAFGPHGQDGMLGLALVH